MRKMAKYCARMTNECVQWVVENGLMDYGGAELGKFCEAMHIDHKTFYSWMKKPEFRAAIDRAKEVFKGKLSHDLVTSLATAAKGYDKIIEETLYTPAADGSPQIRQMRKRKQHFPSQVAAAIFLLCNLDPEHFQNRQRNDVAIRRSDEEREMTIEEINAEIERLEKLDKE